MSNLLNQNLSLRFDETTMTGAALGAALAAFVLPAFSWQKLLGFTLLGGVAGWAIDQAQRPGGLSPLSGGKPSLGKQAIENVMNGQPALSGTPLASVNKPLQPGFLGGLFNPEPNRPQALAAGISNDEENDRGNNEFLPGPMPNEMSSGSVKYVNTNDIMSPETAHALIRQGKYNLVKNAKMSRWYVWGDAFVSQQFNAGGHARVPLSGLQGAARHAKNLDLVCDQVGRKVRIESWLRPNSSSFHGISSGLATDFREPSDFLRSKVLPAVRRVPGIIGVGPSDHVANVWGNRQGQVNFNTPGPVVNNHRGLHVDSGTTGRGTLKPGYQYFFKDNGDGRYINGHWEPMLGTVSQPQQAAPVAKPAPPRPPMPTPKPPIFQQRPPKPQDDLYFEKQVQGAVIQKKGFDWRPIALGVSYLIPRQQPSTPIQERGLI